MSIVEFLRTWELIGIEKVWADGLLYEKTGGGVWTSKL